MRAYTREKCISCINNMEKQTIKPEQETSGYYENAPKFGNRGTSKIRQYFNRGISIFLVIAASILFYFLFLRFTNIFSGFVTIVNILKPILYGLIIAYLLRPIVEAVEERIIPFLEQKFPKEDKVKKVARGIGIAVALIIAVTVIIMLCNMVIPELYSSIRNMIYTVPSQLNQLVSEVTSMAKGDSALSILMTNVLEKGAETFQVWLRTDLLKQTNILMSNLTVGVINFISGILNIVIGFIVSIYVMSSKEQFSSQCKKIVYAMLTPEHANMVLHITKKSNSIFGGFIIGKIIDSIIIGIICFISLTIMEMPYTVLVSVVVGVTNVIPFFGPYIGAIPSAILIILDNPMKGIYFIIFIIVLQQVDGNIIGPKILGDSTGLSAFWVVFAILLGGGLFGFVGMIMGVPTFAVFYYIVGMVINQRLEKKKLPTMSEDYDEMSYVDERTGTFVYSNPYFKKQQENMKKEKE
ncbi:MAG: AI-2E family transporter [Lachnospiraceae bacterium]